MTPRAALILSACLAFGVPAGAQEAGARLGGFLDETDGHLDTSDFLARGGFIPMPIIITEPAVEGGLGIAAYFVENPEPGSGNAPTRTIVGAALTGNESQGAFARRSGALMDGRLLYIAALGGGTINLDLYPFGSGVPVGYSNENRVAYLEARYRFGDSGVSAGTSGLYRTTDVRADGLERFAGLEARISGQTTLAAIGFNLHFDTRDNPLTPRNGVNASADLQGYDSAFGSDLDFENATLFAAGFRSAGAWTFGAMAMGEAVTDAAPFYMDPSIDLRGVPLNRYQGGQALSTEIEIRNQVRDRWSLLAFGGYGRTYAAESDIFDRGEDVFTYGAGFRYRIARKLGLDIGLDVARGPEDTIFYIQFGHAWTRSMD